MSRRKSTAPGDCPRAVLDPPAHFHEHREARRQQTCNEAQVRREFLKEIERWRDLLARNIALRNPGLSVRDLNYAVSKTIDRLIFLRMCEDRGVETYAQLRVLLNGPRVYDRLRTLFRSADDRYNSGLFYFQREKDRPDAPDELTPALSIDDGVLKDIIKGLYYPDCPYEFSVLPAEILGQVYEQFLGKVIRLTKGHRAVVEEKPEVKKAGGVYYTPTYIVDYIVQHTVGKLLEGRTVKWIARDKRKKLNRPRLDRSLRVLDPACGSGSFLLGAYQYLLRWYLDYYTANDPDQWTRRPNPPIHESGGGPSSWRLSIAERKRILLEHIFGVDIDAQAVEVTKLSLLLKVLEGESQQTLDSQLRLFHERALPDLAANIKCGNSL
ncbi:MAG: DNA methyltransferase, partial [Phycisphaerae bacterium]